MASHLQEPGSQPGVVDRIPGPSHHWLGKQSIITRACIQNKEMRERVAVFINTVWKIGGRYNGFLQVDFFVYVSRIFCTLACMKE
jgi:hypothetical protein